MSLRDRYAALQQEVGSGVRVIAVSKYQPVEKLEALYECGCRDFAENRVQSLLERVKVLPGDVRWHFIGHLQRNKVRSVLPHAYMVHSLDSERLVAAVESAAAELGRTVPCLVQVHVAEEESKYGFSEEQARRLFAEGYFRSFPHLRFVGLMCMATNVPDEAQWRGEFSRLRALREWVVAEGHMPCEEFVELSMGMSQDYGVAVEEGSTMVRVGRTLFEE